MSKFIDCERNQAFLLPPDISETPMAKVGYARVSSVGQSLDVQREKLGGCDMRRVGASSWAKARAEAERADFEEKRSGTTDARPMLKQCLGYVREGDQLIVTRIDRLARSTLHLCQIAETLRKKGVDLVVLAPSEQILDQNIDTSDATGRLLFNMLGAIGQFETQIRAERQMDGIKKAKDRGVQFGKRPALSEDQISELCEKRGQGILIKDLMAHYDLSKATIYRYLGTKDT